MAVYAVDGRTILTSTLRDVWNHTFLDLAPVTGFEPMINSWLQRVSTNCEQTKGKPPKDGPLR
jgi:hypothetical protein